MAPVSIYRAVADILAGMLTSIQQSGSALTDFSAGSVGRTLFPKHRPSKPSDYFFSVAGSYPDGESYAAAARGKHEDDLIEHVAIQAWNLGRIAHDKYGHLRRAYVGAFFFLLAWGIARVTLSLAS